MADAVDTKRLARCAFAEFFASLFFVYFGCGSVAGAVEASAPVDPVDSIDYSLAFGFSITVLVYAIGDISGGHINPAVTVAMLWTKNIDTISGLVYLLAQFSGACCGGGLLRASVGLEQYNSGIGMSDSIHAGQGLLLEFMGTTLLIFVVFNVAVWSAKPSENDITGSSVSAIAPIPIGLTVLVCHEVLGPFTGCGINPSRVLGSVIWNPASFWTGAAGKNLWIYFVGPFIASIAGPLFYYVLYGKFTPGNMSAPEHDSKKFDDEPVSMAQRQKGRQSMQTSQASAV